MINIKAAGVLGPVLMLTVLLLGCAHTCSQQGDGPLLILDEESYDFGKIEEGSVVAHVFKFQNCGADTLHIQRVRGT